MNKIAYNKIDNKKMEALEKNYSWIVTPVYNARQVVKNMPFYEWLNAIEDAKQLKNLTTQLYYHSLTFPKVISLMLGLSRFSDTKMITFYSQHIYSESTHHMMLMSWMLKHKILFEKSDIYNIIPSRETNSCINLAYQLAAEQDKDKWLVGINSGIESCSNDFFNSISRKLNSLGLGDEYFDIHVEADQHHSIMGLEYIDQNLLNKERKNELVKKALEAIELWAIMIHSWAGININIHFSESGYPIQEKITPIK